MNNKSVFRSLTAVLLVIVIASFSYASPAKKFSPAGTWEYSVPDVPEGYQNGNMIIVKLKDGYGITMGINEYSKVEAEHVVYKKKSLSFTLYVEYEEIAISGTFDKDTFTGTLSFSQGESDITAVRKVKE